jgi:hypothetical protein
MPNRGTATDRRRRAGLHSRLRSAADSDARDRLVFRNEVLAQVRSLGRIGRATGACLDGRLTID